MKMENGAIEAALLEGMPSAKKTKKRVAKRHFTTKNVPVETSVRRQVAEEIGEAEPTRDQKYVLLQKYGVVAPRIDRGISKPKWMGVSEWQRKLSEWFKMTKGLVKPQQRSKFSRPNPNSQPSSRTSKPWSQIRHKSLVSPKNPLGIRPQGTRAFQKNSGPTRTATPQR